MVINICSSLQYVDSVVVFVSELLGLILKCFSLLEH